MSAYFFLHRAVPREGLGEAADIAWVADQIAIGNGCHGLEGGDHGVAARSAQFADDAPVTARQSNMLQQAWSFELIAERLISDAASKGCYKSKEARIAMLRDGSDDALTAFKDDRLADIAGWRAAGDHLCEVRPG